MNPNSEPIIPQPETDSVCLTPSYRLPIGLLLLAALSGLVQPWVGGILFLLGLFLLYQTANIRLWFTPTAMSVYRGETQLRQFPYQDWQRWEIFWPAVPILFYFKETKSIHFLPILFDPEVLQDCLRDRCAQAAPSPVKT